MKICKTHDLNPPFCHSTNSSNVLGALEGQRQIDTTINLF